MLCFLSSCLSLLFVLFETPPFFLSRMARFSGVDVTAAVSDLQACYGLRAANIYNVGAKAYIFKVCFESFLFSSSFSFFFSF